MRCVFNALVRVAVVFALVTVAGCDGPQASPGSAPQQAPAAAPKPAAPQPITQQTNNQPEVKMETAMFGAGCFWGVEEILRKVPGVSETACGYSGGRTKNPTYEQVCYTDTGHVEVVQVLFDPKVVSYEQLVDTFFRLHDPTQVNGQGPDLGEQYRSVIYYYSPEQKQTAEAVRERRKGKHNKPIATTVEPAQEFYRAEEYHQKYYVKTGKQPYCHVLRPE